MKIKNNSLCSGHRERLKRRFIDNGLEAMADHEMLELLLTYAIPRKDVKIIAKELLYYFGSLEAVLDASLEELCIVKGVGYHTAVLIKIIRSLFVRCEWRQLQKNRHIISSPEDVVRFVRIKLGDMKNEAFLIIYLNIKNHIEAYEILFEGTKDQAVVYPRKIVEKALRKHAVSVIIAHNHPSGICEPSVQDKNVTKKIKEALCLLDIRLLDHIIISQYEYFSFLKHNMI